MMLEERGAEAVGELYVFFSIEIFSFRVVSFPVSSHANTHSACCAT